MNALTLAAPSFIFEDPAWPGDEAGESFRTFWIP
jgi:hypothetical protein